MEVTIDGYTVTIDEQDACHLDGRKWRVVKNKHNSKLYVKWSSSIKGKRIHLVLHRLILNAPRGSIVDHRDGNGLNCGRINLRFGDHILNARNTKKRSDVPYTSRFKGVNWRPLEKKWVAKIRHGGRQHHIGYFQDELVAAFKYDQASLKFHGEQGKTNFLPLVW